MCLSRDGQHVLCDGEDCKAKAGAPVALRRQLQTEDLPKTRVDGWLFAYVRGQVLHFCPDCRDRFLQDLGDAH